MAGEVSGWARSFSHVCVHVARSENAWPKSVLQIRQLPEANMRASFSALGEGRRTLAAREVQAASGPRERREGKSLGRVR